MTHLVLFVDSLRSDTYVNSVVHNLRQGGIRKITFLHVYGFPGGEASSRQGGVASGVMIAVQNTIRLLAARAEYNLGEGTTVALNETNGACSSQEIREYYSASNATSVGYESIDVRYQELRDFLRKIKRHDLSYILDVTGCRKRFFGDFVALGLVDNFTDIRTFDILTTPDYGKPWTMLVHELESRSVAAFKYVDIMETKIMADCSRAVMIRAPRFWSAWLLALGIMTVGVGLNARFGLEGDVAKWTNVIAQFATFSALVFVFFPPRSG